MAGNVPPENALCGDVNVPAACSIWGQSSGRRLGTQPAACRQTAPIGTMTRRHFVMTCHHYVSLTTPIRCRRNARRHEGWRTTPLCPSARRRAGGAGDLYPPLVVAALNIPAGGPPSRTLCWGRTRSRTRCASPMIRPPLADGATPQHLNHDRFCSTPGPLLVNPRWASGRMLFGSQRRSFL